MSARDYDKPNTGASGKGSIGNFIISTSETDTVGVAGTGAIGTFGIGISIVETGVAGTGAIGTEAINLGGWSQDSYGGGSYGDT